MSTAGLLGAVVLLLSMPAGATAAEPATGPAAAAAGPVIETEDAEAAQIGRLLRCPVCQGMPIAESPSEMAQDMMSTVRAKVAAGQSREEILDYFVERYGEWVLLEPKAEGMNLGLWLLPAAALLMGAALILLYARKSREQAGGDTVTAPSQESVDPYIQRIRDEVEP